MTQRGDKNARRGGKPRLEAEDRALWAEYTKSVERLHLRRAPDPAAEPLPAPPCAPQPSKASLKRSAAVLPSRPAVQKTPPPPVIEQRLVKRVQRGRRDIDASIDLHGLNQPAAETRLLSFLREAQARDFRMVLVITGKGRRGAGADNPFVSQPEAGILQRAVRHWLERADFRSLVVGYADAHQRHGGGGALYVQLRRVK